MDLWIRSQSRKDLVNIKQFIIDEDIIIKGFVDSGLYYELGKYATKERALEILDEIQKKILSKGIMKFRGVLSLDTLKIIQSKFKEDYIIGDDRIEKIELAGCCVYEMPTE